MGSKFNQNKNDFSSSRCLIFESPKSVADLGKGDDGHRPFLQQKFFDFSQQKRTKMNL
jgi:hypothetical protein